MTSSQQQFLTAVGNLSKDAVTSTNNPVVTFASCAVITLFVLYVQYLFLRPNVLLADNNGVTLQLRVGQIAIPIGRIRWSEILRAELAQAWQAFWL